MSELLKLAERCEKATGPDRELDGAIKLAVAAQLFAGGATKDEAVKVLGGDLYADPLPYTGSFDAAMTLVPEAAEWEVTNLYGAAQVNMPLNGPDGWETTRREDGNIILAFVECCLTRAGQRSCGTNAGVPVTAYY